MSTNLISYVIPCHGVGRSSGNAQTRFLHHLANKVLVTSKTHLCNLCKNQVARHCERQCHHGDWEGRRRKKWRFKIIISSVSLCGNGGNYWLNHRESECTGRQRKGNQCIDWFLHWIASASNYSQLLPSIHPVLIVVIQLSLGSRWHLGFVPQLRQRGGC